MSTVTLAAYSDTAGQSCSNKFSARFSDSSSLPGNLPTRRSARIKAWAKRKGKGRDRLRPSFSHHFQSPVYPYEFRVEESVHRAVVRTRVFKDKKHKPVQMQNPIVSGLKTLVQSMIPFKAFKSGVANTRKKRATNKGQGDVAQGPPDSSSVAPSFETFIDSDDSVWDYESRWPSGPEPRMDFRRLPNCEETEYFLSDSDESDSDVDEISVNSVMFNQHTRRYTWKGVSMTPLQYEARREHLAEVWRDHKEWLVKRYGQGHAELIVKCLESSKHGKFPGKRILRSTLNLRDKEEHLELLLTGAKETISVLVERDRQIRERARAIEGQVPPAIASEDEFKSAIEYMVPLLKFNRYESAWESLLDPTTDARLSFQTFPWPLFDKPRSPEDIATVKVWDFLLEGYFSLTERLPRYCKMAADMELEKWCPNQVITVLLPRVLEEERQAVYAGANIVFKSLILLRSFSVRDEKYLASLTAFGSRDPQV